MNIKARGKRGAGWIFIFYLVFSIILTWPLAKSPDKYLISEYDASAGIYNFFWQYHSIFRLHICPWTDPLVNYPDGHNLVFFPLYITYGIPSIPFQFFFQNPDHLPAYINLTVILSFALTGFIGYLLFKKITNSSRAGFIAGILFSFIPFHYWHIMRCHVSCLELLLLPVYFYFRIIEERKIRLSIFFGLSLTALIYQSPNYLFYLFIFFAINFFYLLIYERRILDRAYFKYIILSGIIFIFLASPFFYTAIKELTGEKNTSAIDINEQSRLSSDLAGFILPGEGQKIYQSLGERAENFMKNSRITGKEIFPGYVLLFSGMAGLFLARKKIRYPCFWLFSFLIFFILSLGPFLRIAGKVYQIELPYYFLREIIPAFQLERSPVRMIVIAFLSLSVFSAGFFSWLEEKLGSGMKNFSVVIFSLLALLELCQAPLKLDRIPVPELFQRIGGEQGEFSILALPFLPEVHRLDGFYQIYHRKPVAYKLMARRWEDIAEAGPLFFYLDDSSKFFRLGPEMKERELRRIIKELKHRRVKYIIFYLKFMDDKGVDELSHLVNLFGPEKVFSEDDVFRVYQFKF